MGKRLAGTCYFKVDGQQLELQGNLEFPMAKVTRETMVAQLASRRRSLRPISQATSL